MKKNNLEKGYIKMLDGLILEGIDIENEIKRKFGLNKDVGEAKENMAYSGKLYYKINWNRNRTVGQIKHGKIRSTSNELGMKKGFFTCHNISDQEVINKIKE
jgi:hypothetical protein